MLNETEVLRHIERETGFMFTDLELDEQEILDTINKYTITYFGLKIYTIYINYNIKRIFIYKKDETIEVFPKKLTSTLRLFLFYFFSIALTTNLFCPVVLHVIKVISFFPSVN